MFNSEKQKSYVIIIRLKSDLSALCSAMVFSSSAAAGHELVWDGFHIGIRLGCWLAGWRPPPPTLTCVQWESEFRRQSVLAVVHPQ